MFKQNLNFNRFTFVTDFRSTYKQATGFKYGRLKYSHTNLNVILVNRLKGAPVILSMWLKINKLIQI